MHHGVLVEPCHCVDYGEPGGGHEHRHHVDEPILRLERIGNDRQNHQNLPQAEIFHAGPHLHDEVAQHRAEPQSDELLLHSCLGGRASLPLRHQSRIDVERNLIKLVVQRGNVPGLGTLSRRRPRQHLA